MARPSGLTDTGEMVRIPPGEGRDTGHGQRGDVLVTRLGDDPIHAGLPRAWLSPEMEVYYYARGPAERVKVEAYARDSDPKLGCSGRWNGPRLMERGACISRPMAMSGREM